MFTVAKLNLCRPKYSITTQCLPVVLFSIYQPQLLNVVSNQSLTSASTIQQFNSLNIHLESDSFTRYSTAQHPLSCSNNHKEVNGLSMHTVFNLSLIVLTVPLSTQLLKHRRRLCSTRVLVVGESQYPRFVGYSPSSPGKEISRSPEVYSVRVLRMDSPSCSISPL